MKRNPKAESCRTCIHYVPEFPNSRAGECKSLGEQVKPWWTGCVRHKFDSGGEISLAKKRDGS